MKYSNKLTIVLLLKDRIDFTLRWMQYMNDAKCPYEIFIADGGEDQFIENFLNNNSNYPNLKYKYIRYPFDNDLDSFYNKYHDVINLVKTEYVIQADNDDFFILDHIPKLIKALEVNQEIVGVRGTHADFSIFNNHDNKINLANGSRYSAIERLVPSIAMNSAVNRVEYFCKNVSKFDYYSNWYCIYRTDLIVEIWNRLIKLSPKEPLVIEILMHVFILERGKIKIFDFPFYLRQTGTSQFGDNLITDNDYNNESYIDSMKIQFKNAIDEFLPEYNENDKKFLLASIQKWLSIFNNNILKNRKLYSRSWIYGFRMKIKKVFYIGILLEMVYTNFFNLFNTGQKRRILKIKQIEKYILDSK